MSAAILCDHCGEKIVPLEMGLLNETMGKERVIWCPNCVETDYTDELAVTLTNAGVRDGTIFSARKRGYICYFLYPENVAKMRAVPKKVKEVQALKEVIVIKAQEVPKFCSKVYYGASCACSKCGTTGQVLPYRDVFGYGKEKPNEERV